MKKVITILNGAATGIVCRCFTRAVSKADRRYVPSVSLMVSGWIVQRPGYASSLDSFFGSDIIPLKRRTIPLNHAWMVRPC